jgi:hypothetical protein
MNEFFVRGLALILTGVLFVVLLPLLVELFFRLGPLGFVVALVAFFLVGSLVASR